MSRPDTESLCKGLHNSTLCALPSALCENLISQLATCNNVSHHFIISFFHYSPIPDFLASLCHHSIISFVECWDLTPIFFLLVSECCLHLKLTGSASGTRLLRGYFCVHVSYDPHSCSPALCGLCRWASEGNVSISPCHPSYMALAPTMTGLPPVRMLCPSLGTPNFKTSHLCLINFFPFPNTLLAVSWAHQHYRPDPRIPFYARHVLHERPPFLSWNSTFLWTQKIW